MKKLLFLLLQFCGVLSVFANKSLPSNGVYVYTKAGDYVSSGSWNTDNNSEVIGIALLTDYTKALIALKDAGKNVVWGPDGQVEGVCATEYNYANNIPGEAYSDYAGAKNTELMTQTLSPSSNTALALAANYVFPNGEKGYLPALGELVDAFQYLDEINSLLEKTGGEAFSTGTSKDWYWSSTQHYLYYRAWAYGKTNSTGNSCFAQLRNESSPLADQYGAFLVSVRAFGVLPNPNDNVILPDNVEWSEYISSPQDSVINTDIYPTKDTWFEIKIDFGTNPDFWMGCWDLTDHPTRIVSRFFIYNNNLCYDFPDDWGGSGRTICTLDLSTPEAHVIQFGNKFLYDTTTGLKNERDAESSFSLKAPFGLFGLIEYDGNDNTLIYKPHSNNEYKIYYFKAYENDQLIADMRPVKNEQGILCMYDIVRNRYFYKQDSSGGQMEQKCATPTINYCDGKISFYSDTEGVEFISKITNADVQEYNGMEINLTNTYTVSVYAKKVGYINSDVATMDIKLARDKVGDANGDGEIDIADVVSIVNIILEEGAK